MGKKKKSPVTENKEQAIEDIKTIDPDSIEQVELRTKNIVEFAKFSFTLEETREQSLLNQSSHMITAFSVTSAALLMAVPIILEHTSKPKHSIILLSAGIVIALTVLSMVLAVISQWRFEYKTMITGEEIRKIIEDDKASYVYQAQYDYQWIDQLSIIQDRKKQNDDKRYRLINASMIVFLLAIISLFVCSGIIAYW